MLSLGEFLKKTKDKAKIYEDFRLEDDRDITSKLTICIPDMHMLEGGPNDDFLDQKPEYEERFLESSQIPLRIKGIGKRGFGNPFSLEICLIYGRPGVIQI